MNIPFYPVNLDLIYQELKTSTLRSEKEYDLIGLKPGEKGLLKIKDKDFEVECIGLISVEEIGGREKVWKSEGFDYTPIKFQQTRDFLAGKRRLFFYSIKRVK